MIAITFALPSEGSALIRCLRERKRRDGGKYQSWRGKIGSQEVEVILTGVGAEACRPRMEAFLTTERPRLLISAGFAGATSDDLRPGDIIMGENFSDAQLLSTSLRVLKEYEPRQVKLFTSETILDTETERATVARQERADAIEMESSTIAQVCRNHGVPMLSLRAVSDTPASRFPAPPSVLFDTKQQQTNLAVLARYLLGHPQIIPRLVVFGRRVGQTRRKLAAAIVTLTTVI